MFKRVCFSNVIIILFAVIFLRPPQLSYADSFTVNVPNAQGGYTAIVIENSGNGYLGPKGEFYSSFPSVSQLQAAYGAGTTTASVVVTAPSEAVQSTSLEQDFFTVNITNSQGGYTPILIRKADGRFFGPLGENYASFPTVHELQVNYGSYSLDQIQQAVQQPERKSKMLNEMMAASIVAQQQKLNQQAQQQANQPAGQVADSLGENGLTAYRQAQLQKQVQAKQQPKQVTIGVFWSEVMGWVSIIILLTIIGICGYTCFQASKGRMLFFYNWYDLWGSFVFFILFVLGGLSGKTYLIYIGNFGCIGYNAYMAYKYYYPKKQYLNMVLVGFSRIIMSTFIPLAYVIGLFLGPKRDDSIVEQAVGVAFVFGW